MVVHPDETATREQQQQACASSRADWSARRRRRDRRRIVKRSHRVGSLRDARNGGCRREAEEEVGRAQFPFQELRRVVGIANLSHVISSRFDKFAIFFLYHEWRHQVNSPFFDQIPPCKIDAKTLADLKSRWSAYALKFRGKMPTRSATGVEEFLDPTVATTSRAGRGSATATRSATASARAM